MTKVPFYDFRQMTWLAAGYRYYPLGLAMRQLFGCNVWKVSVDAGFSCPNIDGTAGSGGCIFCNTRSFAPSRRLTSGLSVAEQITAGIRQLQRRYDAQKFMAYFQPSTNTYADVRTLEKLYRSALDHPGIVGLAIGTRPDALPDDVLDLLQRLSAQHYLQLEIGLQSVHQKTLDFLRRGHSYETFLDAFRRARQRQIRIGVHLILGVPGEDRRDVWATAETIAALQPESVKLHNLYAVKDTPLAELWRAGQITLPSLSEYAGLAVDFLERQPPELVIERIAGEADTGYLLAPDWAGIKHAARNAVDQEFRKRNTFQGYLRQKSDPGCL
ncbi:MAG: TIGR01212 family radical SAM protein [Planctomycetaceae bacterium]|jgi:radical SAM protein (TIGR01212 family)|nr:TIGR01212 family radical SAM protein [Planctomycetaceae bacterium]